MASPSSSSSSSQTTETYKKKLQHICAQIQQVRAGIIFDKEGYIAHSENPTETKKVLKKFKKAGLLKYLTHNYEKIHALDFTEWFANARAKSKSIKSSVNKTPVTVVMGDIRSAYDFPAVEGAITDLSEYEFDKQAFWDKIRLDSAPTSPTSNLRKFHLKFIMP